MGKCERREERSWIVLHEKLFVNVESLLALLNYYFYFLLLCTCRATYCAMFDWTLHRTVVLVVVVANTHRLRFNFSPWTTLDRPTTNWPTWILPLPQLASIYLPLTCTWTSFLRSWSRALLAMHSYRPASDSLVFWIFKYLFELTRRPLLPLEANL